MIKVVFLLLLLLLMTTVPPLLGQDAESRVSREEFDSTSLNRTYRYTLYLPAGYEDSGTRYPVIYLLHGRGDTMDAWLNVRSVLDTMIANGDIPPIIAVMPDMPSSDRAGYYIDSQYTGTLYKAEAVETAFMNDLLPHIDSTYRTLTNREGRLVGGYSMGGYGALRYSMAYPDQFVGALVLSPAVYIPLPPVDSSTREFGAFGKDDSLFDESVYQSLNYPSLAEPLAETGLPLSMFIAVGDDEWKNPNPDDRLHDLDMEAHMVFNQVSRIPNVSSEFRVYNGGHDWDVWERGFIEGMQYLANVIKTGDEPPATEIKGTLLGSAGEDFAGGIATDSDGNLYQAIAASGSIHDQSYLGELDVVLVKYSPTRDILWTRQFGTALADRAYGVAIDTQNDVIVAGYTAGDLDRNHANSTADDAFVVKFNAEGEQQWALQFGDAAEADRAYALAVGANDQIYVGGYTRGLLNGENAGDKDIYIAQISSTGEVEWTQQFGGEGEDKGLSLAVGPDGTVYLSGVTGSTLDTSLGDLDGFLATFTSEGEQEWVRQFGSEGWDEATGVDVSDTDLIYVTGFAAGNFGEYTLEGDKDIIAAAFDSEGELIWSDQIGTPLNDKGSDVRVDSAGQVMIAGYSDGDLAGSAGGFDLVLLQYDAEHNRLSVRQMGTPENDGADQWAEKNLYMTLAGESLLVSGLTSGSVGETGPFGSGDVFMAEIDPGVD